jgi:hypothetical protein
MNPVFRAPLLMFSRMHIPGEGSQSWMEIKSQMSPQIVGIKDPLVPKTDT